MNILVLGGTGAMGVPLVKLLSETNEVWVTSRSPRQSSGKVHYIRGNAKDSDFLRSILRQCRWDAVIDFMVWTRDNFENILAEMLRNTRQYVFISSARVYAKSDIPITENTPRLLDCSTDMEFLRTEEYSLLKAREENLLFASDSKNYTIIRPSITYNDYRLQLGPMEKEGWLYRALHGRSIVFSEDIADKITTMTSGDDVAKGIAAILGKEEALGEVYNITSPDALPWRIVLSTYLDVLAEYLGHPVNVYWTKKTVFEKFKEQRYRLKYNRLYDRRFDNKKISNFVDISNFLPCEKGLKTCLKGFLNNPKFRPINWRLEGINDRVTGEKTPLVEIPSLKGKIIYIAARYNLPILTFIIDNAIKMSNSK